MTLALAETARQMLRCCARSRVFPGRYLPTGGLPAADPHRSGGGNRALLTWLASPGRRLHYSIGMTIPEEMQDAIRQLPERGWQPVYDAGGQVRPGAWVAELTGLLDLTGWPEGMRLIVRRVRPTPRPSCASPVINGHRFTPSLQTPVAGSSLTWKYGTASCARCEDRILNAKETGLRNPPLHCCNQNPIRCELVAMACELLAWTRMLALHGPARAWEPKRLRLRLFSTAPAWPPAPAARGHASQRPSSARTTSPPRSPACRITPG